MEFVPAASVHRRSQYCGIVIKKEYPEVEPMRSNRFENPAKVK
jgi:hypothetical protein